MIQIDIPVSSSLIIFFDFLTVCCAVWEDGEKLLFTLKDGVVGCKPDGDVFEPKITNILVYWLWAIRFRQEWVSFMFASLIFRLRRKVFLHCKELITVVVSR
jgi:hypothetical protein